MKGTSCALSRTKKRRNKLDDANDNDEIEPLDEKVLEQVMRETPL